VKTTEGVLLVSASFSLVTGSIYWFTSYEAAGSFMLLTMTAGLTFAAAYVALLRRRTAVAADRERVLMPETRGEAVGVFASHSPWPVVLALSCAVGLTGIVYGWWLIAAGVVGGAAACAGLMREDREARSS
jgi:Cytochrome c oxidase subunit IV